MAVGIVNTLIGCIIMFALYNAAGCSYWVSSAANYILTSILSFFLNKYFTFQNHEQSVGQVVRFAVNIIVCYLLAYGIAKPLIFHLLSRCSETLQTNIAMAAGMCFFTGFNYIGQRYFAFRNEKYTEGDKEKEKGD